MPLHIHRSNRTETLVDGLVALLRQPLADPLAPECIVVQGRGMERWLSMQLAERLGIWGNPAFPFPRRAIAQILAAFVGSEEGALEVFDLPALTWAVATLLPAHLDQAAFAPIRRYVDDDPGSVRLVELAERIAATFDRYLVYRPTMIDAWEHGRDADWQAILWRALIARHGGNHLAAQARALSRKARTAATPPDGLAERICLFGVSSLPPLYLDVLVTVARLIEVHLFVLSPSREYWGEVRSRREILRELGRTSLRLPDDAQAETALHLSEGHPLVASLGGLGRDFLQLLEEAGGYVEEPDTGYIDPGKGSMLATLHSDMLALRSRSPRHADHPPLPLASDDQSIAVHVCHGPMREVEVLHDQLLALFDDDPTLQPHEVLVMSPAIDTYAPFIEAVFGAGHDGRPVFRYRVADRSARASDGTYDAFCRLLDALGGRLTASEVVDLLELDPIRSRAGLAAGDVETARQWIRGAGIRWGIDEHHRKELAYPAIRENTWRFGLDRLLLGYAMQGGGTTLFGRVLPFDGVEGSEAAVLGRLAAFCEQLFTLHDRLRAPRSLARWASDLQDALATLVDCSNAGEHLHLRHAIETLGAGASAAGFETAVALDVARTSLDRAIRDHPGSLGFLDGGITFCALVPMRSIPFRVIALLGMNDETFPRAERLLGFDRVAGEHRLGDRSARNDDRYTFLEALLSTRERLIITYVGQSIRDNTPAPPSVVVSELLDALEDSFEPPAGVSTVRDHVEVRHRLQAFNPTYFRGDDARLFSYARGACAGAQRMLSRTQELAPLLPHPLPAPSAEPLECTLDAFTAFLEHPIRGFLQERLGLLLGDDLVALEDREPMDLDALAEWKVGHGLLEHTIEENTMSDALAAVRATGALPPGNLGALCVKEILPQVAAIVQHAAQLRAGAPLPPLEIDVTLGEVRLTGELDGVWPAAQVHHQFSKLGRRSEVRLWIRHLLLLLLAPSDYPRTTVIVGRDARRQPAICRFREIAEPRAALERLTALYSRGQSAPLVSFPNASRVYATVRHEHGPAARDRALAAAHAAFTGNDGQTFGDYEDPYIRQIHGARDPFTYEAAEFEETALTIFQPLLMHRELGL